MARREETTQCRHEMSWILRVYVSLLLVVVVNVAPSIGAAAYPDRLIYVSAAATGTDDGSSWINAYRHLQDALAAAGTPQTPVEIRVAQGIYKPDQSSALPKGTGDRKATFYLLDNVAITGGFAGVGADPNARDIALYETILSGDLAGNDVAVVAPCDLLTEPTRGENSYTVVTAGPCSRTTVLDGLTIRGGNANAVGFGEGGGLSLAYNGAPCCPSIRNCTFLRNSASFTSGAVRVVSARPELLNCAFVQNAAGSWGGAMLPSTWRGPGTRASQACDFVIKGCVFAGNYAQEEGGAIWTGAGIPPIIEGCTFTKNSAKTGGAIRHGSGTGGMTVVTHCRFIHNLASQAGGAVYLDGTLSITSCTFFGNTAPTGKALACLRPSSVGDPFPVVITNTILWDGSDGIHVSDRAQMIVTFSDVRGGWPGQGNLNTDPLFANPVQWDPDLPDDSSDDSWVSGDYHLKSRAGRWDPVGRRWVMDNVTSPCIDAGDPGAPVGQEPQPNGGRINMGAYGGTPEASKS